MITPGLLKRISLDGLPDAVALANGAIRFRHYHISVHALDRFVERYGSPADAIVTLLHDAVVAYEHRAKTPGIRRVIRVAEARGGYVLLSGSCFFVVVPDKELNLHVVATVMTPKYMTFKNRRQRAARTLPTNDEVIYCEAS